MTRPMKHELIAATSKNTDPESMTRLRNAQEFILDHFIDDEDLPELLESAQCLHKLGIFKLPFPVCTFQIPVAGDMTIMAILSDEMVNQWHKNHFVAKCISIQMFTTVPSLYGKAWQHFTPGDCVFAINALDVRKELRFVREGHGANEQWRILLDDWEEPIECDDEMDDILKTLPPDLQYLSERMSAAEVARSTIKQAIACIALIHTKGIRKQVIVAPEKLNKARLKCRKEPINACTVIRIQEHLQRETVRGPAGERHRMRLHTRRGHLRHQHYGPRNSKIRQILIAPCLVGYEEEGIIIHDHYEVDERVKVLGTV